MHFAQVLKMAIEEGSRGAIGNYPEKHYVTPSPRQYSIVGTLGVFAAVAAATGGMIWRALKRKR